MSSSSHNTPSTPTSTNSVTVKIPNAPKKRKNSLKTEKIKRELCKLRKSKTFQNLGDALDYFSD